MALRPTTSDRGRPVFDGEGNPASGEADARRLLKKKESYVSEICQHFEMTQPSISHHLDILKRCKLVTSEKRGREVYYRYNGAVIIVACCGTAFQDLDIQVKES